VYWTDPRLIFDPNKYGVGSLFLTEKETEKFWSVLVRFMNVMSYNTREAYFYFKSTGYVTHYAKGVTESHFATDFSLFPFDKQGICLFMRLGSEMAKYRHASSRKEADLMWKASNPCNLGHHTQHGVWSVLRSTSNSTIIKMGTKNTFDFLTGCMIVQRRLTNYMTKVIFPALMITLIACVSFWIDPRGECTTLR
jgi:hypothetical protein